MPFIRNFAIIGMLAYVVDAWTIFKNNDFKLNNLYLVGDENSVFSWRRELKKRKKASGRGSGDGSG